MLLTALGAIALNRPRTEQQETIQVSGTTEPPSAISARMKAEFAYDRMQVIEVVNSYTAYVRDAAHHNLCFRGTTVRGGMSYAYVPCEEFMRNPPAGPLP